MAGHDSGARRQWGLDPLIATLLFLVADAEAIYRGQERTRPLDLANAIRSFAVLRHEVGAAKEAQALWQEAHDLYAALNASAGVAESAARLAPLARGDRDPTRSREWLIEASAAADAADDPETQQYIRDVTAQLETSPLQ